MPRQRLVQLECNPRSDTQQANEQASATEPFKGIPAPSRVDALYAHVPFCFHKCHYCDFYSIVENSSGDEDRQAVFTDALIAELSYWTQRGTVRPRTIFVGGGTPTLLRVDLWDRLLRAMADSGVLAEVTEFTVEANPETVTPELMRRLAAGGVNRVSMGAQSFQPALLKTLERWHDPASVGRAMAITRDAGITNLNLDLIFAIPGQDLALLDADLDAALALAPNHLSAYNLMYEPNTALTSKLRLGRIRPVEEDLEAQMYERVLQRLADAGYEHYEISNWAKPGARCAHNLAYWRNENWLAVGPSASGHLDGYRWKNEAHLGRYLAGAPTPPRVDEEHLDESRRLGEQLMLRLRVREGVELSWLAANLPPGDERHRTIDELVAIGMLERTATHLRLTHRGLFVADAVIAKLI